MLEDHLTALKIAGLERQMISTRQERNAYYGRTTWSDGLAAADRRARPAVGTAPAFAQYPNK